MARPVWSGVITFGLVSVSVQLFSATEGHATHFHQLQRGTGDRVRNRRVNERTGKDVPFEEIVKGYELGDGEYVVLEPEELDKIAPAKSQALELDGFVDEGDVPPVYFDRTYYLAPRSEEHTKIYELLRSALEKTGKLGVGTFVMRGKEHFVALRAADDALVLHTLHWADEIREPERELPRLPERSAAKGKELQIAQQLVETLSMPWQPEEYEDTYEQRVQDVVEAKRNGEEIVTEEEAPQATNVVDLQDALRRSVDEASGDKRKGSGGSRRKNTTARRSSGGSASGKGKQKLADLSKDELYARATDQGIRGRSHMNRQQLLEALSDRRSSAAA